MRAVVFDFDGVLVDSEPLHFRALRDSLLPEGIALTEQEYQAVYLAYDDREAVRLALERAGRPSDRDSVAAVAARKAALFEQRLPEIDFFPGARELVAALALEMPIGIASGALRGEIEAILEAAGLRAAFGAVVGADDVGRTKPHPEPYLAAVRGLRPQAPGLEPAECVAIEDSPPGILAARTAGLFTLGVAHTYPAAKLKGVAHAVVGSLEGLRPSDLRNFLPRS